MTYQSLSDLLKNRDSRNYPKLAHTRIIRDGEVIQIQLHETKIAEFSSNGSIRLWTGGWKTQTTKARLNEVLGGTGLYVYSVKGIWEVTGKPFSEGITCIPTEGGFYLSNFADDKQTEKEKRLLSKCKAFARGYTIALAAGKISPDNSGDCFVCRCGTTHSCLENHMEEKYYHVTLLSNAVRFKPVSRYAEGCIYSWLHKAGTEEQLFGRSGRNIAAEQVRKSVFEYCKHVFGLSASGGKFTS
jgi:hypothetical protein